MPRAIAFVCPECGETMRVPETMSGARGRCTSCDTIVQVPSVNYARLGTERLAERGLELSPDRKLKQREAPQPITGQDALALLEAESERYKSRSSSGVGGLDDLDDLDDLEDQLASRGIHSEGSEDWDMLDDEVEDEDLSVSRSRDFDGPTDEALNESDWDSQVIQEESASDVSVT